MTAQEFWIKESDEHEISLCNTTHIETLMIEFAKYHVEQALKNASNIPLKDFGNYIPFTNDWKEDYRVDEESILKCYPLNNIK